MRIGTIGSNIIVDAFIDAVRLTGKAEAVACYSRSEKTAGEFVGKHGISKWYTDPKAFFAEDMDFVYVASPNSLHYSWTMQALKAGKNVICEKPFTSTAAELQQLVQLARSKGLFLFEALTVPHLPNYKLLKQHIAKIGRVKLLQLNFSQYSSRYDAYLKGDNPNVFSPEFSGGALMDLNYYNINFVLGLYGIPIEAVYYPNKAVNGIDTSGLMIMKYDGFLASAVACKDSVSKNSIQIQGEKGYIEIPSVASTMSEGFTLYKKQGEQYYNEQKQENVLYYEMLDFIEIYGKGDPTACDERLQQGLACMRLLDTARKQAGIIFKADKQEIVINED